MTELPLTQTMLHEARGIEDGSLEITDPHAIDNFIANPENPFLVSFPRTGSHWLRMIMELYFKRPSLVRSFYYLNSSDFLMLHTHDLNLDVQRQNVIYLYREPVDTIYSQLRYHHEGTDDPERIAHWAELYGRHLDKWLHQEAFTDKKTIITYEGLRRDLAAEFAKVTDHFGQVLEEERLQEVARQIDKQEVRKKTSHDLQVVQLGTEYEFDRQRFRERHSSLVWDRLAQGRPHLLRLFADEGVQDAGSPAAATPVNINGSKKPKVVGLVPARNEAPIIGQCLKALSLYTDAIVYLDDHSDDDSLAIVESLAGECRIEKIIRKARWSRDEPGDRNALLQAGREIGGTHFVALDADEMFTANCLDNNFLRDRILAMAPGDRLSMVLIVLWRDLGQYRFDTSRWTGEYADFAFCDDGNCSYTSSFIHTTRSPGSLTGTRQVIEGYDHGVLHFQFVNWRNLLIKQAWYRCLERIRLPEKPTEQINSLYAPSSDEADIQLRTSPPQWFSRYGFFRGDALQIPEKWRAEQVMAWFKEYGIEPFADLHIWNIHWPLQQAEIHTAALGDGSQTAGIYAGVGMYMAQGREQEAETVLRNLLCLYPDFAPAHNDMGVLCLQRGEKAEALLHYEQAVALQPGNATFLKNLADFYYVEEKRIDEALQLYVAVLSLQPDDVDTLMTLGNLCTDQGRFDDALFFFTKVVEMAPTHEPACRAIHDLHAMTEVALPPAPIIVIDGIIFQIQHQRPAGISRVWLALLSQLGESPLAQNILLLDRNGTAPAIPGIRKELIWEYNDMTAAAEPMMLQDLMEAENGSLFISTYYTYPESSPCMIILHDMTPEMLGFDLSHPEWTAKAKAIEKSCAYFTVSESTCRDFRKLYPHLQHRPVYVIPNAVSDTFRPHSQGEIDRFKRNWNIDRPYYLICGHRLGYKNAALFFRAFSLLEDREKYDVLCTGGSKELEKIFSSALSAPPRPVHFLSDSELSTAMGGATALVYPSLYEGFGLPVLEAMQSACPVITCPNSAIPEVAGDAALFVDGHDVEGMKRALCRVREPKTRAMLIGRGLEQAQRFSWQRSGSLLRQALADVLQRLPHMPHNSREPITAASQLIYSLARREDSRELTATLSTLVLQIASHGQHALSPETEEAEGKLVDPVTGGGDLQETLKQACREAGCDGHLHYWHALLLQKDGNDAAALAEMIRAAELIPTSPRLAYLAAQLADTSGLVVTATRLFSRLLDLEPDCETARERLATLLASQERLKEGMEVKPCTPDEPLPTPVHGRMPAGGPAVSVILPSKNRPEGLRETLDSLVAAMGELSYEVILYLGDGQDRQDQAISNRPEISHSFIDREIFPPGEQFSWPRIINHGFSQAAGTWVMYASDDIVLHPGCFAHAVARYGDDASVGGITFLHRNTVEDYDGVFRDYGYDTIGGYPFINFGIVRKEAFLKTAGFDDRYRFYWADVDLCLQLWQAGYRIVPSHYSLVEHNNIVDKFRMDNAGDRYFDDTLAYFEKWQESPLLHREKVLAKERFVLLGDGLETVLNCTGFRDASAPVDPATPVSGAAASPEEAYARACAMLATAGTAAVTGELEQLVTSWPDFAIAHNDLGVLYCNGGQADRALRHYRKAVELAPANTTFLKNLADYLQVVLGKTEDALELYVKLLTAEPRDLDALLGIGKLCAAVGKLEDARCFFNRALEVEPWNAEAREAMKDMDNGGRPATDPTTGQSGTFPRKTSGFLVSAIVSTHNAEKFMAGCLESLEAQTIADQLEIIVVDSGSEENERAVVSRFQSRYDNIRYIRTEERETVYQAWNRGIRAASGTYITNANTDDRHRPDALEKLAATLDAHADVALVYGDIFITFDPNLPFAEAMRAEIVARPEFSREMMLTGCHMGPQPMWRATVHEKAGYFNEAFTSAGDYEFWCRMALAHGMKMLHLAEVLGCYYFNRNGIEVGNLDLSEAEAATVKETYAALAEKQDRQKRPEQPIDIIFLTYNRPDYFKKIIAALLERTRYPYRIIVVDNHSREEFRRYLQMTAILYDHLVLNDDNYFTQAFQRGIDLAVSDPYVVSDPDIIVPDLEGKCWLERVLDLHRQYPEMGLIALNLDPVNKPAQLPDVYLGEKERYNADITLANVGTAMQSIKRRFFDGRYATDWETCAQIRKNGGKVGFARNIVAHHLGWDEERDYPEYLVAKHQLFLSKFNSDLYMLNTTDQNLLARMGEATPPAPASEEEILSARGQSLTSIIILTFNQLKFTEECLESIQRHTPEPHEIIFVDNGSQDGTDKWLRHQLKSHENYRLIENKKNLGFAKGCNQGIVAAKGDHLLLLNNDVVVTAGWLSGMLACLHASADHGIVGPMTNSIAGPQQLAHVPYTTMEEMQAFAAGFREDHRHRRIPVKLVVGFCMLFRRALIDRIGPLDEAFAIGNFEDDDLCLRASLAGLESVIAGDVFVHHHGHRTFKGNNIDFNAAMAANRQVFDRKWDLTAMDKPDAFRLATHNAMIRGQEIFLRGETDEAVRILLEEGIKFSPADRRPYRQLASMLTEVKRFRDALDIIREMPESGRDAESLILEGTCLEGLEQWAEAVCCADRALAMQPFSAPALNLKGVLAFQAGKRSEAEALFHQAMTADPGFGEAYTNLGVLRWSAQVHDGALELLEKGFILNAAAIDPMDRYHAAITAIGAFHRGEGIFREARAIFPASRAITFKLIDLLLNQQQYGEAMAEIEQAMVRFGTDDGIINAALQVRKGLDQQQTDPESEDNNGISLCMIAKNETAHIAKALVSVKPLVSQMVVVDTGSTDRTADIARAFGAAVHDIPWPDSFAAARNEALSHATGSWILVLDADEVISEGDHEQLRQMALGKPAGYALCQKNYTYLANTKGFQPHDGRYPEEEAGSGFQPNHVVRFFPNDQRIRFENPVHELVEPSLERTGIPIVHMDLPIHHYGKLDQEKLRSKWALYYELGKKKLAEQGGDGRALTELAVQAAELERYDEALALWQQVLRQTPRLAQAHFNMGYIYLCQGRYTEGLKASQKAMELDPDLKEAVFNYGCCQLYAGEIEPLVSMLERLLEKHPRYPSAIALLTTILFCLGEREKGLARLEEVRAMLYDSGDFLFQHAKVLFSQERFDWSRRLLEAAINSGSCTPEITELYQACTQRAA